MSKQSFPQKTADTLKERIISGKKQTDRLITKTRLILEKRFREAKSASFTRLLVLKGKQAIRDLDTNSRQAVILQHRLLLIVTPQGKACRSVPALMPLRQGSSGLIPGPPAAPFPAH